MAESAPQPPTLLLLPRELRNLIYSYLHVEEEPGWCETGLFPPTRLLYRVHNAPFLNVLHSHPRLRKEYLEAIEQHGVSVTLCDRDPLQSPHITTSHEKLPIGNHRKLPLNELLTNYIKHILILVVSSHDDVEVWTWNTTQRLVSALVQKAPNLSTLRIETQYHSATLLQHHNNTYSRFQTSYFMEAPPPRLETMQLVQRVEGYRLEQGRPPSSGPYRHHHRCLKYGCYLYATIGVDYGPQVWKPGDGVGRFWVEPYEADDWNIPLPTWVMRHEFKEWREKHGHEGAVGWF
jgi:hypothetical protein